MVGCSNRVYGNWVCLGFYVCLFVVDFCCFLCVVCLFFVHWSH